jgi:hypothetical protein
MHHTAGLSKELIRNERGIALPTAMILMVILMALTFAFANLGTSEPVVARNHAMAAQARAFAESGLERALWAMASSTQPTFTSGVAATPYDGTVLQRLSAWGGYTVRIIDGASASEKLVEAVGWAPDVNGQLYAARKVQSRLLTVKTMTPPCALCVMGTVEVGGSSDIDARTGHCTGVTPVGGTMTTGTTTTSGSGKIFGPGNNTANESDDTAQSVAASNFDSSKLTADELAVLKSLAQANGSYYQGAIEFGSSTPIPNGIVFVDTTTGAPYSASTPDGEAGVASITGNITWSGWLIVNGSISISGNVEMRGLVYAMNDATFTGNGDIFGAVITENRKDTSATIVDSSTTGSSRITYDCNAVRTGNGTITNNWVLVLGSYREIEGR